MKDGFIKVAAATPQLRVADPAYNCEKMRELVGAANGKGVQILVFPELAITGSTCGDLFWQETLLQTAEKELTKLAKSVGDMLVVVGAPIRYRHSLYNCAVFMNQGHIIGAVPKSELAGDRHFKPAEDIFQPVTIGEDEVYLSSDLLFECNQMPELLVAAEIGEDLWAACPPSTWHGAAGATLIVNPAAMAEIVGREEYRRQLVKGQTAKLYCAYVYAGAGEGESTTDYVFAGHRLIGENGSILAEGSPYEDGLLISEIDVQLLVSERRRNAQFPAAEDEDYEYIPFDVRKQENGLTRRIPQNPFVPANMQECKRRCQAIMNMQIAGLKKRIEHTRCKTLVIGISGGLDSTLALLVAAGAMDRLGRDRKDIIGVTMPCFGTTKRTKGNAEMLCQYLGVTLECVDIMAAVNQHFADIGHDPSVTDVTYENSQARERTQILMDIANEKGGMVVGTGDLSELALGWATYNGDHMSMYGVNADVPKTMIRYMIAAYAGELNSAELRAVLRDILATPVSPELLPAKDGEIAQKTEEIVGPYEIHDFVLYYALRYGFAPSKIYRLAKIALGETYEDEVLLRWLRNFYWRFFQQQFKRSCLPDGPKVGSVGVSPRGDLQMPSDAVAAAWLDEVKAL